MNKAFLVLLAVVFIASFVYAEEPKTPEKVYTISGRIEELTQEANKMQNLINQALARIEQIKGAVAELQKAQVEQKKEDLKKITVKAEVKEGEKK